MPNARAAWKAPLFLSAIVIALGARSSDAQTASSDPAARGLDVFLHVPDRGASGGSLPIQIEAFGFATSTSMTPLATAEIEAVWNPEKLGPSAEAPPAVRGTTDASGRLHLDVPIPVGDERELELLVGVTKGKHQRTHKISVQRAHLADLLLRVSDSEVVPGDPLAVWARITSASTGLAIPRAPLELTLLEGGIARFSQRILADASGAAVARIPLPRNEDPAWQYELRATALAPDAGSGPPEQVLATSALTLRPRESSPSAPWLSVSFDRSSVFPGDHATYVVRLTDAANEPVAGAEVRTWVGPHGTDPPRDDVGWLKASKLVLSDALGEVHGDAIAPSAALASLGTSLRLVVKAEVEGKPLERQTEIEVGAQRASIELEPEAGRLLPGVMQRALVRATDARGQPLRGDVAVEADGLSTTVTLDRFGEAELSWDVPADVGAKRRIGPCAGDVAAAVHLSPKPVVEGHDRGFDRCLRVDRKVGARVLLDRTTARVGDRVHVAVALASDRPIDPRAKVAKPSGPNGPWSVVLTSANGEAAVSGWMEDGDKGLDLTVPEGKLGNYRVSVARPGTKGPARVAGAGLVVAPRILPKISARIVGGRVAPGGTVDVDAWITDERGNPLRGSITAVLSEFHEGIRGPGFEALDTRRQICAGLSWQFRDANGATTSRCDAMVEGDPSLDGARRADLAELAEGVLAPKLDPGGTANEQLLAAFREVLASLEGEVFEVSSSPDDLRDAVRVVDGKWQLNPELLTLVTAAMSTPPVTPGGEPITLADLVAVDPQVTFEHVARRVARLKLFHVLTAVRDFRAQHRLDHNEPALRDPNALLRRLVTDGTIGQGQLLDPWGGTMRFQRASSGGLPFLTVEGFELRAPGPDGKLGTGDDVKDPFERVVKSGTPYADAMREDAVVDAKLALEVSDASVDGWRTVLEAATGTALGSGTGQGFGSGHGRLGGSHRTKSPQLRMGATRVLDGRADYWMPLLRTDDRGHVLLHVPLADIETTWNLSVVGLPDGAPPAADGLKIPVALPLSARIEAGGDWVEGDSARVAVLVRNRSDKAVRAHVELTPSGELRLEDAASRDVDVPARGVATVYVNATAKHVAHVELAARVRAEGLPEDAAVRSWSVRPAAEATDFTNARWIEADERVDLGLTLPSASYRLRGAPRLVLERGATQALEGALGSLEPDAIDTPGALAAAIDAATRLDRWARGRASTAGPAGAAALDFATRASTIESRAVGRLLTFASIDKRSAVASEWRAWMFVRPELASKLASPPDCPVDGATDISEAIDELEAEPPAPSGSARACWDVFADKALDRVIAHGSALDFARLSLAFIGRPHRAAVAATLVQRLRERVKLRATGETSLEGALLKRRAARATIYAALLRGAAIRSASPATPSPSPEVLARWVLVQRDADGGFGSAAATRDVVRALLSMDPLRNATSARVTVRDGANERTIDVGPDTRLVLPLDPSTTHVVVASTSGLVARFERPVDRLWSSPPDPTIAPMSIEAIWPDARARISSTLRIALKNRLGRPANVLLRVPLPPGAKLAAVETDTRQIDGALLVRRTLDASEAATIVSLPLRFALAGTFTTPEISARLTSEEAPRAVAPATLITVAP